MDGGWQRYRLGAAARWDGHGGTMPERTAHPSSPYVVLRSSKRDVVFPYGIDATQGTYLGGSLSSVMNRGSA
jgi:hypothetical protein